MNHQHGIGSLLGNIRPVMISTAAIANDKLVDTKPVTKHLEANEIVSSRIAGGNISRLFFIYIKFLRILFYQLQVLHAMHIYKSMF